MSVFRPGVWYRFWHPGAAREWVVGPQIIEWQVEAPLRAC